MRKKLFSCLLVAALIMQMILVIPATAAAAVAETVTTLGSGFNSPFGVAVDGSGNIYVADTNNNAIKKISWGATAVNALALDSLVTAPVKGATPGTTAIDQTQYTGTVAWYESDGTTPVTGNFAASTVYKAKVTLTAKTGYTLTGVAQNSFTYTGAASVANAADSGTVTSPPKSISSEEKESSAQP
ncbi:MAG: hypothetical protein ACYCV0_02495 [Desulfitobacteriaceae bacterium]